MTAERHTVASEYVGAGAEAVCVSGDAGGAYVPKFGMYATF